MSRPTIDRSTGAGPLLRTWRERRRLSQLDLALEAGVSTRHLSFIETGRSRPSPEMIHRLAEELDIPLRERNDILVGAGHAPGYTESDYEAPALEPVRRALDQVLKAHEPYPAVVIDRRWNLVSANQSATLFLEGIPDHLREPPVNVLRLSLHPLGLTRRTVNAAEFRAHLLALVERQAQRSRDPDLLELLDEIRGYPAIDEPVETSATGVFVPLKLKHGDRVLSFFNTLTTFGTPLDITVAELSVEAFYPADDATGVALRAMKP